MHRQAAPSNQAFQTANHAWFSRDVLGQGATGAVYKGRNTRTGELVAIKHFSIATLHRNSEVHAREFEIMAKLKHKNIVKFIVIENEIQSGAPVIVMELCSSGSLFDVLDLPVNFSGMSEEDFLQVMIDVTAGLKYLRSQNFVHRDIKPGNIMRHISDDGICTYKLTDFGAARELGQDEMFTSMYGTEEYLHPDMYKKAVLHQGGGTNEFGASVDLWSVGVTLYHVATGRLPFRPLGGGRANRKTMFDILKDKPKGAISGVEKAVNGKGEIRYQYKLPEDIQLSKGLQNLLVPILAGILECKEKTTSFERFFVQVENIKAMKAVYLYHIQEAELHHVFMEPDTNVADLQRKLLTFKIVTSAGNELYFGKERLGSDSPLPSTTETTPLLLSGGRWLVGSDLEKATLVGPRQPRSREGASSYEEDTSVARSTVAALHHTGRVASRLRVSCENMKNTVTAVSAVLAKDYEALARELANTEQLSKQVLLLWEQTNKSFLFKIGVLERMAQANKYDMVKGKGEMGDLQPLQRDAIEKERTAQRLDTSTSTLCEQLRRLSELSSVAAQWDSAQVVDQYSSCTRRVGALRTTAEEILDQFRRDKRQKVLSHHENQIHQFEKLRLLRTLEDGFKLVESYQRARADIHTSLLKWMSSVEQHLLSIREHSGELQKKRSQWKAFEDSLLEFQENSERVLHIRFQHESDIAGGNAAAVSRAAAGADARLDGVVNGKDQLLELSRWVEKARQELDQVKEQIHEQHRIVNGH